ncbi:hypothetical protein Sfr7A_23550 [Streptomyces xinghaiensis]|uniref:Glycoside hydrolase family 5 domain-containing protein n=1 Tax=Streptomyces xinghaiensis TaxID=1038928 RepID=A0A3R7INW9_9ACTN|nr:hypothetical protein Sfr7A_23550 [Streptomyces xinghaiensis]RKM92876.1 hypothetical protein SFRA_023500 [Streptomyces xinghaiensis]RNC72464.1 hypothetical protein DC095_018990 [Streptomyces xinghaiensis]
MLRRFEDDDRPMEWKEDGFAALDRVVTLLARHGLYSVIDLHALPGAQNHHWHSDNPTHRPAFWTHRHFQDRAVALREELADRYRDRPEVAGYNPVNEPSEPTGDVLSAFYERLERAIRAVDPRHILFLDGNRYATDFSVFTRRGEPFPNCVCTAHDYALPGIASGTGYPGTTRGEYFDRSVVEETFLRRTRYMRGTGTPVWIGEFFGPPRLPRPPRRPAAGHLAVRPAPRPVGDLPGARRRLVAVDVQGHRLAGHRPRRARQSVPAPHPARSGAEGTARHGLLGRLGRGRARHPRPHRRALRAGVPGLRALPVGPAPAHRGTGAARGERRSAGERGPGPGPPGAADGPARTRPAANPRGV